MRGLTGELLGSIETWPPGIIARRAAGEITLDVVPAADVVVANPPCSRFSNSAVATFKDKPGSYSLAGFG